MRVRFWSIRLGCCISLVSTCKTASAAFCWKRAASLKRRGERSSRVARAEGALEGESRARAVSWASWSSSPKWVRRAGLVSWPRWGWLQARILGRDG